MQQWHCCWLRKRNVNQMCKQRGGRTNFTIQPFFPLPDPLWQKVRTIIAPKRRKRKQSLLMVQKNPLVIVDARAVKIAAGTADEKAMMLLRR